MKRIISLIAVVAMLATMCSFSAMAADTLGTLTMTTNSETNKVSQGEEIIITATLDTTNKLTAVGFKFEFDANDIELGTSAMADAAAEDYAELIGTEDFPTLDSVTETMYKRPAHVDDTAHEKYKASGSKMFDSASIGAYELKGETGYITFGYAGEKAKNALNKTDNFEAGAVVLKVKTAEKKQTTISLVEATAAAADGVDTPCAIVNTITLDLNGYGEVVEPEDPTAKSIGLKTDDSQILRLANIDVSNVDGTSYKVDTALGFVSCVNKDANATGLYTEINLEGWTGEALKIPAKNTKTVGDHIYFVAAVTSIREANLKTPFTAKAYATVDGQLVEDSNTVSAAYDVQQ